MRRAITWWTASLAAGWLLAGCATTGDPRQGGLFGWSEDKARERQTERQKQVDLANAELSRETARTGALEARHASTDRDFTQARTEHQRAEAGLHAEQMALLAKIDELERESPTPALASRARNYRLKVNTIAAQTSLTTRQRLERLRAIEAEIDTAIARLKR